MLVPLLLVPLVALIIGWFAFRTAAGIIERQAMQTVGHVAELRHEALVRLLERQQERTKIFLDAAQARCAAGRADERACLREALVEFVETEGATGARLTRADLGRIEAGSEPPVVMMEIPQGSESLASFDGNLLGSRRYELGAARGSTSLVMRFPAQQHIDSIFRQNQEVLGKSGESFLADARGFFLTPHRYPSSSGESHPIHAQPMRTCLAGRGSEMIDPDYRNDVRVVHGFRYIPEIGGGCIMAHIDYHEAMAPARQLRLRVLGLGGLFLAVALAWSWIFGRFFAWPLARLTDRARALEAGDFTSEVPMGGPAEVRTFARTFETMARSLEESRAKLEKAVRVRDDFISVASHELRTPLTTLRLQLQSMISLSEGARLGGGPPGRLKQSLERCDRQVDRMIRLIEDMLDVSRIRAGKLALRPEEVDLAQLVRSVLDQWAGTIERSGSAIDLHAGEPVMGVWDRFRIEQVFINLLSNALKYGAGKPLAVRVEREGELARLSVQDHGPGIAPEDQARIFEPFERAVSVHSFGGLGLGLSIVRAIVRVHGGEIRVQSELGNGTTFTVELPRVRSLA